MSPPDEPPFRSNRTDAATYAAEALDTLRCRMPIPGEQRRGYLRDALAEAFAQGELQGEFRALWVLAIAHRNAKHNPEVQAALVEVVQLLAPDVAATWEE
jgi:hypothetical protein